MRLNSPPVVVAHFYKLNVHKEEGLDGLDEGLDGPGGNHCKRGGCLCCVP